MTEQFQDYEAPGVCPFCEAEMTHAISVTEPVPPSPGDITFCTECGQLTMFTDDLALRPLTLSEMLEAITHPEMQAIVAAWAQTEGGRSGCAGELS